MKECKNCNNFQPYYVRNDGKFFITNYGYCCIKGNILSTICTCSDFDIKLEKQKLILPSKLNIHNAVNHLFSLIENLGVEISESDIGVCKPRTDLTPYNARLE